MGSILRYRLFPLRETKRYPITVPLSAGVHSITNHLRLHGLWFTSEVRGQQADVSVYADMRYLHGKHFILTATCFFHVPLLKRSGGYSCSPPPAPSSTVAPEPTDAMPPGTNATFST